MQLSDDAWRSIDVQAEGQGIKVVFRNTRTGHLARKHYSLPPGDLAQAIADGLLIDEAPSTFHTLEEID